MHALCYMALYRSTLYVYARIVLHGSVPQHTVRVCTHCVTWLCAAAHCTCMHTLCYMALYRSTLYVYARIVLHGSVP